MFERLQALRAEHREALAENERLRDKAAGAEMWQQQALDAYAEVERLRAVVAVAAPPEDGPVVAVPVRELNGLRAENERLREERDALATCVPAMGAGGDSESFMAMLRGEEVTDPCCYCGLQLDDRRTAIFGTPDGSAHIACHYGRMREDLDGLC